MVTDPDESNAAYEAVLRAWEDGTEVVLSEDWTAVNEVLSRTFGKAGHKVIDVVPPSPANLLPDEPPDLGERQNHCFRWSEHLGKALYQGPNIGREFIYFEYLVGLDRWLRSDAGAHMYFGCFFGAVENLRLFPGDPASALLESAPAWFKRVAQGHLPFTPTDDDLESFTAAGASALQEAARSLAHEVKRPIPPNGLAKYTETVGL